MIDTDPEPSTSEGGAWWDVGIPEISERNEVVESSKIYLENRRKQNKGEK